MAQGKSRVIEVNGLRKEYSSQASGSVLAIEAMTFDIYQNEFVSIVGTSGCGKSTTLRLLAGLTAKSAGSIKIYGKEVTRPGETHVGIVFQTPTLLRWRRILENVLFSAELLNLDIKAMRKEAQELLELTGLKGFERHYPHELSGGMQQRVAICRALVHDPPLLLMDEPFGALDALTREEMGDELLRIWDERRKTCLFITHSMSEAVFLSDRVIIMTDRPGRIKEALDIPFSRPRHSRIKATQEFSELVQYIGSQLGLRRD